MGHDSSHIFCCVVEIRCAREKNEGDPERSREMEGEGLLAAFRHLGVVVWKPSAIPVLPVDCHLILLEFCKPITSFCLNQFTMGV